MAPWAPGRQQTNATVVWSLSPIHLSKQVLSLRGSEIDDTSPCNRRSTTRAPEGKAERVLDSRIGINSLPSVQLQPNLSSLLPPNHT